VNDFIDISCHCGLGFMSMWGLSEHKRRAHPEEWVVNHKVDESEMIDDLVELLANLEPSRNSLG
jgi:hypothetical protein